MGLQSGINRLIGTAGAAVTLADKLSSESKQPTELKTVKQPGVDAKMALKARKVAQQKINAIYANKELSNKARTRRMGQVMDEYNKAIGGTK